MVGRHYHQRHHRRHPSLQVTAVACVSVLLGVLVTIFLLQQRPVYLVDYHVYRAPERCASIRALLGEEVS